MNMGMDRKVKMLSELNPEAKFEVLNWCTIKVTNVKPRKLCYPYGYIYSIRHKTINNKKSARMLYESFNIVYQPK